MSYDPYTAKMEANPAPVISQPVHAHQYYPTVTAAPAGNYVSPVAQSQPAQITGYTPRPPAGRWRDSICDCFNNLYPSCYCPCCCCYGMWLVGQMAQKTGFSSLNALIAAFAVFWLVGIILTAVTGSAVFIIIIPLLYAFIVALVLRVHVAKRENITECGGPVGEFCTGFWCWYCSVAQMARHLYGYTKVLDGDGDPDRPDNYGPVQGSQV